ncbi:MAG: hypothetical protein M1312_02280 [Patescibacteria group bacterium]|nr:hypothetical protein [Patescibacteria group bacterium]
MMPKEKKKKGEAVKVLALAVVFGMVVFSGLSLVFINSGSNAQNSYLNSEGNSGSPPSTSTVPCLVPGVAIKQEFKLHLAISVDGKPQGIPSGIGVSSSCTSEITTIDSSGTINIKAQDDRQYTLGDFFTVWGQSFYLPGYGIKMMVNGKSSSELENLVLAKNQQISLTYSSSTTQ